MAPPPYQNLVSRLPRTFGPALNDQFRQWDLLFPAERRVLTSQLDWLAALSSAELKDLFAPLTALEARMDLPQWHGGSAGLSIEGVGVLARSPLYPQWRTEVEKVFARIDEAIQPANALGRLPRLVICALPSALPIADNPLWPDLESQGKWIPLAEPFSHGELTLVSALAQRKAPAGLEEVEATWVIECIPRFSSAIRGGSVALSWDACATVRRAFLNRLNAIQRDLKSADQTTEELRRWDISSMIGPALGSRPQIREFVRGILLSGNGSLVFNNSFVQWSASEALRRAQPQVLVAGFGVRQRLKPFSSMVLFEDQNRSNPVADQDDPAGSLIDSLMLSRYVHLSAQRFALRPNQVLTLFACADLPRVLAVGPPEVVASAIGPLEIPRLSEMILKWLAAA